MKRPPWAYAALLERHLEARGAKTQLIQKLNADPQVVEARAARRGGVPVKPYELTRWCNGTPPPAYMLKPLEDATELDLGSQDGPQSAEAEVVDNRALSNQLAAFEKRLFAQFSIHCRQDARKPRIIRIRRRGTSRDDEHNRRTS